MNISDMKEAMKRAMKEREEEGKGNLASLVTDITERESIVFSAAGSGTVTKEELLPAEEKMKVDIIVTPFIEDTLPAASGTVTDGQETIEADVKPLLTDKEEKIKKEIPIDRERGIAEITHYEFELLKTLNSLNTTLKIGVFIFYLIWLIKTLWGV